MIVCLGCGRIRPLERADHHTPPCGCGDVSWTFLEDAERDPAGVARCIERRKHRPEPDLVVVLADAIYAHAPA